MTFKTRPDIKKHYDTLFDFGVKNLIVSGCSFTYNNHDSVALSWPYYLRDLGGFDQVFDSSMSGGGNHHISNSLIWSLELSQLDPAQSLVIVMWSGCDRDDYICPQNNINDYGCKFHYSKNVMSGITGGSRSEATTNTIKSFKEFSQTKTLESRAIENYLYFCNTWHYLSNQKYRFVFLQFLDANLPSRTRHFDIKPYLPETAQKQLSSMMLDILDPYSYALKNDFLAQDDFHPSPKGQLNWTKQILIPKLQERFG